MLLPATVHLPVKMALDNAIDNPKAHVKRAEKVTELIEKLAGMYQQENHEILNHVHPVVRKVLCQNGYNRHLALTRELISAYDLHWQQARQ